MFEISLISVVCVIGLYFLASSIVAGGDIVYSLIDFAAACCGICSVVLCAKGKKSGFVFGLLNAVGYSLIAYSTRYYGEVLLNVLFYIPINIISYVSWKKNQFEDKNEVIPKKLTLSQSIAGIAVVTAMTVALHVFLNAIGGAMTVLDGTTTILSIASSLLMWRRYAEQWLGWIVVDGVTVCMWAIAGDVVMTVMWLAYLVNAFYGYILWRYKTNMVSTGLALK